jgi:hypothetical protein
LDFSKAYKTIEKFYIFRNSRVFEMIFTKMSEVTNEMHRSGINPSQEISVEEFDR